MHEGIQSETKCEEYAKAGGWCLCRAEKEAVEQRKADLASALQQRKANQKAALQAEPVAGTPNTAAIRIRLPDGSTAQRRFLADEPLQVQRAHVFNIWCIAQHAALVLLPSLN